LHMNHDELFIYKRHYNGQTWLVIANFSKEEVAIPQDLTLGGEVIIQHGEVTNESIDGFGAIVIAQ